MLSGNVAVVSCNMSDSGRHDAQPWSLKSDASSVRQEEVQRVVVKTDGPVKRSMFCVHKVAGQDLA